MVLHPKGKERQYAMHITSLTSPNSGYIVAERSVKECPCVAPQLVQRMVELDFSENEVGVALSRDDQKFLKIAEDGIHHREDSQCEMPLPFKHENIQLPNNCSQAEQRLNSLKKTFQTDSKYHSDYQTFVSEIILEGYAQKVSPESLNTEEGQVWYIPHHGIYRPKKPDKIRVVFDYSVRYYGQSLNDNLLQGPDLTNSLVGVLTRFREENFAYMADIEKMFYQVKVKEADQDFLRFLWWPDANTEKKPEEYRMTVHLFGAVSNPGCAN